MPEYIQIVEYQTSDIDSVRRVVNERSYGDGTPEAPVGGCRCGP